MNPLQFLRIVAARLKALTRRDVVAGEIKEELQFHVDMRSAEYQSRGLAENDAKRTARRRFGNVALMQDRGYDVRGGGVLETILQDVRYGVRLLARRRGFALVAILTLALGVGVTTALFSVIDAVVFRSLPYPRPEQMVSVAIETISNGRRRERSPSPSDVRRWREMGGVFVHIGTGRFRGPIDRNVVETPEPERVTIGHASEDFLEVYGITPLWGRPIQLADIRPESAPVVVLGHAYWVSRFGADPNAVGRTFRLDGTPTTIVGILPRGFYQDLAMWRPAADAITGPDERGSGAYVYGRLQPGISLVEASHALTEFTRQADASRGEAFDGRVVVQPMRQPLGARPRSAIGMLSAAAILVLLIACVNVAGLLLARGALRQPELAVRASLGAGRPRLVRQLLTESLVLSVAATAVGLVLAWLSLDALVALVPLSLPPNAPAELTVTVLAAALGLALLLPLVFGLLPALRVSRVRLGTTAAVASRRHGPALSRRSGHLITAVEIALAVMLLAGAGLTIRSFQRLVTVDLGFDPDAFLTMEVMPVDSSPAGRAAYYPPLLDAVRKLPGVASAGAVDSVPLGGVNMMLDLEQGGLRVQQVLPGFFETLSLRPLEGRLPTDEDRMAGRAVIVLSQPVARQFFPDGALGRALTIRKIAYDVIGVVPSVRASPFGPARGGGGAYFLYDPRRSSLSNTLPLTLVIRPDEGASASALASSLRQAARSIGPPVIVERIRPGRDWLGDQVGTQRNQTLLLSLLGGFALLLTVVGVFSVTAFAVARRAHEIGVRMAFGARPGHVVWETVRDAAWPVTIGLAAGLAGASFGTQVISSFLFETTPTDPVTFALATALMAIAALLAAWLPARRAARVDPVVALRAE